MRILFVSQTLLRKELGGAKVLIELAEEMRLLGWECDLTATPDLVVRAGLTGHSASSEAVRAYLREHAGRYDVVDYDHLFLPYPRGEFDPRPLFVARSVLLHREEGRNPIPSDRSWKSRVRSLIRASRDAMQYRELLTRTRITVTEADLVNVANYDDKADLVAWGVAENKIVVLPYGLSTEHEALFDRVSSPPTTTSLKVAFVGTFDSRKGAFDFPRIVQTVTANVPASSFLLLGTFKSEREVLRNFPSALRKSIQVIPKYEPNRLPELLAPCSVGVFPSYLESFGFGVLEMLAAGLPLVAYQAPGPPMMLPPDYLVPRGDTRALSAKIINLLNNKDALAAARSWAKARSRAFRWKDIAQRTADIYLASSQKRSKMQRIGAES